MLEKKSKKKKIDKTECIRSESKYKKKKWKKKKQQERNNNTEVHILPKAPN